MRRRVVLAFVVALAASVSAGARQGAAPIEASELGRHPFRVGGLELTVTKLDGHVVLSDDARDTGVAYLELRVANTSDDFARFVPSELVIVGKDGRQASVVYERRGMDRAIVAEVAVAPRAFAEMKYNLSARVRFPAQLYYDGKVLAEVVD